MATRQIPTVGAGPIAGASFVPFAVEEGLSLSVPSSRWAILTVPQESLTKISGSQVAPYSHSPSPWLRQSSAEFLDPTRYEITVPHIPGYLPIPPFQVNVTRGELLEHAIELLRD